MKKTKNILITVAVSAVFFIAPTFAHAYTIVTDDRINSDTEWTADNSPYVIVNDFTVPQGVTLTIDPGVTVEFSGRENLYIWGTLVANGTSDQKVYFASVGDDSAGAPLIDDDRVPPFALWGIVTEGGTFIMNNGEIRDIIYGIDMDGGGLGWTNVSISGDDPTIDALDAPLDFTNVDLSGDAGFAILLGGPRAHLNSNNVSIHDSSGGVATWSNGFISGTGLNFYRINGQAISMNGGSLNISNSNFSDIYAGEGSAAMEITYSAVNISSTKMSNIYGAAINVLDGGNFSVSNTSISSSTEGIEINDNVAGMMNYNPIVVNNISSSTISGIDDDAIDISGTNMNISSSSLTDIGQYAVWNASSSPMTIAENNYWGDLSGPYNPNTNPNGLGSAVSDNVDFSNWLGSDPTAPVPPPCCSNVMFLPGIEGSRLYMPGTLIETNSGSQIVITMANCSSLTQMEIA